MFWIKFKKSLRKAKSSFGYFRALWVLSGIAAVEPDGTFEFMAGGSDEVNDIITNIVVTGVFTDDSYASGTFKTSDIFFIKRDSSCAGSFLYDISWEAAKDCSLLPDEGVSATRFCH